MLYAISVFLVILWLCGITMHVGGGLIHGLLVIAVGASVYSLLLGRRHQH